MLETMLALKNNDMRKIPGYDPEPVEKLRRLQRSLVGYDWSAPTRQYLCISTRWLQSTAYTGRLLITADVLLTYFITVVGVKPRSAGLQGALT